MHTTAKSEASVVPHDLPLTQRENANAVWRRMGLLALFLLITASVTLPNIANPGIDDLDSAHHLMDGYFFRDLLHDHPLGHPAAYVLTYYKQYPALGFVFWPPLIPLIFGLFCTVGGVHVVTVRACMFCFGLLFCASYYALLRRHLPVLLSVVGVVVAATVPGMVWSFNEVMLELPTVAMMCVAALAYFHFVDHLEERGTYGRAVLCALACAALIYCKQPAWFLLPVLLADYLVRVRPSRWYPPVLLAAGLVVLLDVPLAVFTWLFGKANLGQSIGSSTTRIMQGYHAVPRWSVAAWTYYPRLALSSLDAVVVGAALVAIVLAVVQREFFRRHIVWFAWFAGAYLTFSYYDNRAARHATFWWPAWVALAVCAAGVLQARLPRRVQWLLPVTLLLLVPWHLHKAWTGSYTEYSDVQVSVGQLFAAGNPGVVLAFGLDKQVLTTAIREHDTGRSVHVLRGERLLAAQRDIAAICHDFRVDTVLVETGAMQPAFNIAPGATLRPVLQSRFQRAGQPVTLTAYHYSGPMAQTAATVSLSNALTK